MSRPVAVFVLRPAKLEIDEDNENVFDGVEEELRQTFTDDTPDVVVFTATYGGGKTADQEDWWQRDLDPLSGFVVHWAAEQCIQSLVMPPTPGDVAAILDKEPLCARMAAICSHMAVAGWDCRPIVVVDREDHPLANDLARFFGRVQIEPSVIVLPAAENGDEDEADESVKDSVTADLAALKDKLRKDRWDVKEITRLDDRFLVVTMNHKTKSKISPGVQVPNAHKLRDVVEVLEDWTERRLDENGNQKGPPDEFDYLDMFRAWGFDVQRVEREDNVLTFHFPYKSEELGKWHVVLNEGWDYGTLRMYLDKCFGTRLAVGKVDEDEPEDDESDNDYEDEDNSDDVEDESEDEGEEALEVHY